MLSDGQGEMKGEILRIARIGYLDYLDCIAMHTPDLEQVLAQLKPESFQYGDGLRAAQLVYAGTRRSEVMKIVVAEKIACRCDEGAGGYPQRRLLSGTPSNSRLIPRLQFRRPTH